MISTNLDLRIKLESEPNGAWVKATDIGLIVARGVWPRAVPKTNYIDIPGTDGKLDLSEVLRPEAAFSGVTGTILFIVLNRDKFDLGRFINHYHGRRVMIRMGDDDNYYRVGRCWVSADDRKRVLREFTLTVDAEPYRYALRTKSVTVSVVAATHPAVVKVLEYRKHHVDPDNKWSYDKTTGTFVFNTTSSEDHPKGTIGIAVSPNSWYSFAWSTAYSVNPINTVIPGVYLSDGTEVTTPGHFYTGANAVLRVEIYAGIEGMVLFNLDASGTTVYNEGRKILTPNVFSSAVCRISGNFGSTEIDASELTTVATVSTYKFTSAAVGKNQFYVQVNGIWYYAYIHADKGNVRNVTEADITAGLGVTIDSGMLSAQFFTSKGNTALSVLQRPGIDPTAFPSVAGVFTYLTDIATLKSSTTSEESTRGSKLYDFQLGPGVNSVVAYADSAGGEVTFTYREGLL